MIEIDEPYLKTQSVEVQTPLDLDAGEHVFAMERRNSGIHIYVVGGFDIRLLFSLVFESYCTSPDRDTVYMRLRIFAQHRHSSDKRREAVRTQRGANPGFVIQ